MTTRRLTALLVAGTVYVACALAGAATAATPGTKGSATDLSNASCLSCHDTEQPKIEVPVADGDDKRTLRQVDRAKFGDGVHAAMECINCHREINDSATPHRKTAGEKRPDCAQCHVEIARKLSTYKTAGERRGLRIVAENVDAYTASSHVRQSKDDPSRVQASCDDCHSSHDFYVPAQGSEARK